MIKSQSDYEFNPCCNSFPSNSPAIGERQKVERKKFNVFLWIICHQNPSYPCFLFLGKPNRVVAKLIKCETNWWLQLDVWFKQKKGLQPKANFLRQNISIRRNRNKFKSISYWPSLIYVFVIKSGFHATGTIWEPPCQYPICLFLDYKLFVMHVLTK